MSVPFLLTLAQMRRIRPHFPLSHGLPRVDDRLIIDSTHLKAHRTAASPLKRGRLIGASAAPRAG
jgi:hypothetical protein